MKIVINALAVDGGGGQTYLENLLPEFDRLDNANQYVVLLRKNHSVILPRLSSKFKIVMFSIPRPYLIGRFLVEQFVLPGWLLKEKVDLFYSPADATTLLSPAPVVLAMRNPNLYVKSNLDWTFIYKLKFKVLSFLAALSTKKARRIIIVSNASKKMIAERISIPEEKIKIIHHGVSRIFFKLPGTEYAEKLLPGKTPFILSVSSVYRYKNYIRLVEAFNKIQKRLPEPYHLIIIGTSFDKAYFRKLKNTIRNLRLESSVHYLGGFRLIDLPGFYQKASLFAFPSFLETFGHTLVEAMASKLPIAAADIPPTREIAGSAARYFDPFNIDSIGEALVDSLTNAELRKNLITEGQKQVQRYSWENCAKATLKTFSEAISIK